MARAFCWPSSLDPARQRLRAIDQAAQSFVHAAADAQQVRIVRIRPIVFCVSCFVKIFDTNRKTQFWFILMTHNQESNGPLEQGWANSNQIKSTQKRLHVKSNQIKSWMFLGVFKSNQIMRQNFGRKSNQIKSNQIMI